MKQHWTGLPPPPGTPGPLASGNRHYEILGDRWALGKLGIAAEHLAGQVVVQQLKAELAVRPLSEPVLLAACLPGEHLEWGVLSADTGQW